MKRTTTQGGTGKSLTLSEVLSIASQATLDGFTDDAEVTVRVTFSGGIKTITIEEEL